MRVWLLALLALTACSKKRQQRFEPTPGRFYEVRVSDTRGRWDETPVVFLLHAYSMPPQQQDQYFKFAEALAKKNWLLVIPEGLRDAEDKPYWNATEGCCDRFGTNVDDLAFIDAVAADVSKRYAFDHRHIYAVGSSNGGFFAHRLACERSSLFTAVVSVTGAGIADYANCKPIRDIAVLQVHGDEDELVLYDGGTQLLDTPRLGAYPSPRVPVEWWAKHNGCSPLPVREQALDFDKSLPGNETRIEAWGNCRRPVELWTVVGGKHWLPPSAKVTGAVLEFLERATSNPR